MTVKRVNSCDGSVLIKPPFMSGGLPNIDCPAAMGKAAGHVGTKMHMCVMLVPGS